MKKLLLSIRSCLMLSLILPLILPLLLSLLIITATSVSATAPASVATPLSQRCLVLSDSVAENLSAASLFASMPDSLMPYLTENNRLDMIDFMEAKMKAEVTNRLDGKSEMLFLTSDSLSVRLSGSMKIDLLVIPTEEVYDSCRQMVCLRRTFIVNGKDAERVETFYSASWRPLPLPPVSHHAPMEVIFGLDKVVDLRGGEDL